jgi:hypothetical protein
MAQHLDISRGIELANELARETAVAIVDHNYWHLVYYLVIIDPRIEQRIDKWHDDEEDEYALVLEGLLHLLAPYIGRILDT